MSKIDDLIKELCPNGVMHKALWSLTTWDKRFNAVDNHKQPKVKKYFYFLANDLKSLILKNGDIKILTTSVSNIYTSSKLVDSSRIAEGEVVCIPWGGNPIVQYYNGKFITADNRICFSNDDTYLSNKYLYYVLTSKLDEIKTFYRGSGIKHPNMQKVLDLKIPVPPLEVQKEIVRVLDSFTELEAELEARKKQYEYYRNTLLTFEDDVVWKPMSEVGELIRGNGLQKKDFIEEGFPCIHYGQIYTYYGSEATDTKSFTSEEVFQKLKKALRGDVLIAGTSENINDVCKPCYWNGYETIGVSGDMFIFRPNKDISGKYLTYVLQSDNFMTYKRRYVTGTKVIRLSADSIKRFKIPALSLEKQKQIVSILDKFEKLTNDISIGLPAEIEVRRKQYEYYRNKLLTFKELECSK